jgi:serine/threonine protein kinase
MTQIIKGLQVLHNKKIIHHDLKPENILVDLNPKASSQEEEKELIKLIKEKTEPKNKRSKQFDSIMSNGRLLEILSNSKMKLSDFGLSKYKIETNKVEIAGSPLYIDPNLLKPDSKLETVENEKVDIWALGIIAYELFFYDLPFQPFPPSIERLNQLFKKGEYTIDFKRHDKISKQFISFLNCCLQDEQKIRPLTDELLFHEFIVRDPKEFTYITIDNYKNAKYPKGDYLREEGKITMSIKDNRNINAYFDWNENVK